jgi:uncharacterized protein (TIGR02145 family)
MRQHKILYFFILAFLFITVACGDDSSASADTDDESSSSYVEDSGSSKSKNSSSSKKDSLSSSSTSSFSSSSYTLVYDPSKVKKGSFVDKRDGHEYKTITIEKQTWMAQNLNYAPASSLGCHEDDDKDCSKYGRIYTWAEVVDSTHSLCGVQDECAFPFQGICPDGWRIPQRRDWELLFDTLYGGRPIIPSWYGLATILYSKDNEYPKGTDDYGFSVRIPKNRTSAQLFITTELAHRLNGGISGIWGIYFDNPEVGTTSLDDNSPASLRCIKDDQPPTLNDPMNTFGVRGDDRKFCSKAEPNSNVSSRTCNKNGVNTCNDYVNEDGSIKLGSSVIYFEEKGKKACPFEWHIPSKSEWYSIFSAVGGECYAGYMLKAQEGWGDDYAFDAIGLGIKPTDGTDARFLVGGTKKGEIVGRVVLAKGSNIAKFEDDTSNTSGLLCVKGRLIDDTLSFMNPSLEYGTFTDTRDNRTYKTINIGHTKWMAENLNYVTDSSICYNHSKDDFYCNRYGRFYLYEEAKTACPAGWRLPTKKDLDTLLYIGSPYKHTHSLVSAENPSYKGNNKSGFSLVTMGSQHRNGKFYANDKDAFLWSATELNDSVTYILEVYHGDGISDTTYIAKLLSSDNYKGNIRCVSDEKVRYGYMGTYGTLTDSRDGHEYKTVEINGATWMAENLDYASSTASCHRDSCDINGMHYTYPFSADTLESLCPEGWHISTTADWDSLLAFVRAKDSLNYAYDLKDPFAWPSNEKGNDKYGFGLLPNTCYYDNSGYDLVNVRDESVACIGAESPDGNAGYYYIHSTNNVNSIYRNIYKRNIQKDSRFRYGIRCVKDK